MYDAREFPLHTGGNVYYNGARPYSKEANPFTLSGSDPKPAISDEGGSVYLHLTLWKKMQKAATSLVTTDILGKAKVPGLAYENADGSPLVITTDYFGKNRNATNPSAGPFENPGTGKLVLKVW